LREKRQPIMSYYYTLTPDQITERKNSFDRIFRLDDNGCNYVLINYEYANELQLTSDYIGYLIFRALRSRQKYINKEIGILKYFNQFHKAEYALEAFIRFIGMDSITTINPIAFKIMNRLLATDSL